MQDLPIWRSMLFVPATAEKFVEKAHTRGADAIIVDLEDSVAASEKARARALVPEVAQKVGQSGADVVVRINRPLRQAIRDIEGAVGPGVHALSIPKAESAQHVRLLSEVIAEVEAERGVVVGQTRLIALIETAEGYANAADIAACERVTAITLGSEDFADAMGIPVASADQIAPYLRDIVLAARRGGCLALGYAGSIANFSDLDFYRGDVLAARAMGFDGGACIHPAQVPLLNAAFTPSKEEAEHAERIVAAYDLALAQGTGAIELDGQMIDVPIANRAKRVLATLARIKLRS